VAQFDKQHGIDVRDPDALTVEDFTQVSQDWLLRADARSMISALVSEPSCSCKRRAFDATRSDQARIRKDERCTPR